MKQWASLSLRPVGPTVARGTLGNLVDLMVSLAAVPENAVPTKQMNAFNVWATNGGTGGGETCVYRASRAA